MPLITPGFINSLDPSSPTNTEFVDEGNDWIQAVQEVLKTNQFSRSEDDSSNGWDIACTAKCSQVNALDDLVTTESVETRLSNLESITNALSPIGSIVPWPIQEASLTQTLSGSLAPGPGTWHWCDGTNLDGSTTYSSLYTLIGNQFGGTDAASMLIPKILGRVIAGRGTGNDLTGYREGVNDNTQGNTGGEQSHLQASDEMYQHIHDKGTLAVKTDTVNAQAGAGAASSNVRNPPAGANSLSLDGDMANAGGTAESNIVQPTIILAYYIRVL